MFLGLRIPLARAHALAQRAGLGTKVTVVVWLVAVFGAILLAYFWLVGHWFAAVLTMPVFAIVLGEIILESISLQPRPISLAIIAACALIAWVPFAVRRA